MPSWNDLLAEVERLPDAEAGPWLVERQASILSEIGKLRGDRNVLLYASTFLQKPLVPSVLYQINYEDINGFMSGIYGMDWNKGLTLILHTPGGIGSAAEAIVSYLWSKFSDIEVIVPTYAMSAGTMISLAANRIVMGRQSQLGPIDPQMPTGNGRVVSARAIVDQFNQAKSEILADKNSVAVWAPILQSLGPALLQEAQYALDYGEGMVGQWLARRMLASQPNADALGKAIAKHFNDAGMHKSHGRRIDRDEARGQGVVIEDLEANQTLQELVLSVYHLITIAFEKGPATKVVIANTKRAWVKNFQQIHVPGQPSPSPPPSLRPQAATPQPKGNRRVPKSKR